MAIFDISVCRFCGSPDGSEDLFTREFVCFKCGKTSSKSKKQQVESSNNLPPPSPKKENKPDLDLLFGMISKNSKPHQ